MASGPIHLSLVVPMYNESARILEPLREMAAYLRGLSFGSEIVLVDDGSSDDTGSVVVGEAPGLGLPLRFIRYEVNRGKGYALKVGFEHARGELLVFSDCDLSTPIEELPRFVTALQEAEIAIGTRRGDGSRIERHQPWFRETLGRIFTFIVRLTIAPVSDATCGFKGFRRDVGRDLFARQRIEDWCFDAELLANARARGHSMVEVPVQWFDQEGTKVRLTRDVIATLVGIVRIRLNHLLGRYAVTVPIDPVSLRDFGDVS